MSFINLYFVTIPGKRIMTTLPEDFQLTNMLEEIRNKINDRAVENCIFLCKGKRLSLDDPIAFQDQKRKLINNGDVIFIGNKITNYTWNQTVIKESKNEPSINIYFITATGQQIISKIPQQFKYTDFVKTVEKNFGKHAMKNSRFISMGEELLLNDHIKFARQKELIRQGSIIIEIVQTKNNIQNDQNQLVIREPNIFQNLYILLPILFLLICCMQI